ncbi:MAG: hypothetical protein R3338_01415 [Thermoanaerobaculia bacterium]|nr:hypothetical protein [Thermoanaerobaculia bacterium]
MIGEPDTKRTYAYRLGRLSLTSDIALGLPSPRDSVETSIRVAIRSSDVDLDGESDPIVTDGGTYWLYDERILYRRESSVSTEALARELLDVILPEYLASAGEVVLHASVVLKNGRAVLITGASGSGKSTTALLLERSGWKLGSDDFAIIHDDLRAETFGGPVRVWSDVEEALRVGEVSRNLRGKSISPRPWLVRRSEVVAVLILSDNAVDDLSVDDVEGGNAFSQLIRACFRPSGSAESHLRKQIEVVSKLVAERKVASLLIPRRLGSLDRMSEELSALLEDLVE